MATPVNDKNTIEKGKVLFVEGYDEVNFFDSLLKYMGGSLREDIQVVSYDGKAKLNDFISMISKTESFIENVSVIAITRDADNDMATALESINYTLKSIFRLPKAQHNTFVESDVMKAGAFVLPGTAASGELEDLVLHALAGNDVCNLVDKYLNDLKRETQPNNLQSQFHFPRKESKARIQIYFSSMKESDTRTGIAAQRKYVDFGHHCFDDIKAFLLNM